MPDRVSWCFEYITVYEVAVWDREALGSFPGAWVWVCVCVSVGSWVYMCVSRYTANWENMFSLLRVCLPGKVKFVTACSCCFLEFSSTTLKAEIWENGSVTTMKSNKATNTSSQPMVQCVNNQQLIPIILTTYFDGKL